MPTEVSLDQRIKKLGRKIDSAQKKIRLQQFMCRENKLAA
jgi:hypothetical protein